MIKSIAIPEATAAKILERAKAERRSFSGQVIYMCESYLNDKDSEQGRYLAQFIEAAR
jgi:hypothetical protein